MSKVVLNQELIEVPLVAPATGKSFRFPLNKNVFKGEVYAIEYINSATLQTAPSGVPNNGYTNITVTVKEMVTNNDKLTACPVNRLDPQNYVGQELIFELFKMDIQNSFVTITDGTGMVDSSACFNIFYKNYV